MKLRWLVPGEKQPRAVESSSVSDVLALAMRLQTQAEDCVSEDHLLEMGRELGIRPEYVREALMLRRQSMRPDQAEKQTVAPTRPDGGSLVAATVRSLLTVFAVGLL